MMKNLPPYALITGGSSGIGWAIACRLAALPFNIILVSNQTEQLNICKKKIEQDYHVCCEIIDIDLSSEDAALKIFDYCRQKSWNIEILVNNAGILVFSEVADVPVEKVATLLQLHISTPTLLCRLFGEQMKNNRKGHILNVSSISAVMPYPGISLYGPTKSYLRYFTRALRSEMSIYDVRVTCVLPGATATALYDPQRINISLAKKLGIMHDADFVARNAVHALLHNKAECIPGWINKVAVWFLPFLPALIVQLIHRHTRLVHKGRQSLG